MKKLIVEMLEQRGVKIEEIADLVLELQKPYLPNISLDVCIEQVEKVLDKREVQNAMLTGMVLDVYTEKKMLPEPLQSILETDEGLYGVDEVLALSITNIYGSIGFTNFGYLDKIKIGILERLNNKKSGKVHTFLDDLVAAIAASAASRLAHGEKGEVI
ncbi:phosphatidylglycerophosphatase A [Alkalicella caledoniensis]|uniref:Phosphatidylglycerophosphatase A n=1 Tax=Alkalicella caledoniensis TaxID=2731377 RepID=A0A7G9WAD7_ALKCA|nr:phosphatidylglycerophosphatase A [Alkalicella caledoniensis]QNO15649.1 phosphatidylglycerophosphatase A [Alkalicella caledoniensis]